MSSEPDPIIAFLLVPGAGGDAWHWHRLVDELADRGSAAIPVDLPADDPTAGLDRYADAAVEAERGRGSVIVVAHSLGGFTAPLVCSRLPVIELVLVNAMIPRPGETAGECWGATGHDMAGDFDLATHFFLDVPPDIRAEGVERWRDQSERPFADPWPLAAWPDVDTRAIASTATDSFRLGSSDASPGIAYGSNRKPCRVGISSPSASRRRSPIDCVGGRWCPGARTRFWSSADPDVAPT